MLMQRVAFVGKGGAGKSTIAGTFARLLARRDPAVLALDSDPMPGLPYSLGIAVDDHPIPDDVVVPGPEGRPRWVLRPGLDAQGFVDRYAARGPDGVLYLQFGNLWGHVVRLQQAQHAWSQVVDQLDRHRWHLVGDLPGGTRQAMAGWAKYADTVCLVVEPTVKSLHTARRLMALSKATWAPKHILLVVNKAADDVDASLVSERLGLPLAAVVPHDLGVARADRSGDAPLDAAPDGPFVSAVDGLVSQVEYLYARS
ncbi:MAG: hypothetical protein OXG57_07550 [Acidimicrobiaceae bacterium]|nr:hypothetical protein [Acidimicrobiaceae bacterium]